MGYKIPPKQNNFTPIKPSKIFTMTHEEEELQCDISKLRYQVQQISILQRAIKYDIDGLKEEVEAKLDSFKYQMKANMDDKVVEYHIKHQQQVLQLSNDNLALVQNQMKQQEDQHHICYTIFWSSNLLSLDGPSTPCKTNFTLSKIAFTMLNNLINHIY